MTSTDELRRLLDERGVEWSDDSDDDIRHTTWNNMSCWFSEFGDGWTAWGMSRGGTPEQAIAATLGDADYECRMDELLCRLTNGKWSKSRSYSVDFMVSCVDEAYEDVALGEKRTCETCDELGNVDSFITHILNAKIHEGTCRIVASSTDGLCSDNPRQYFELSCGHSFTIDGLERPIACAVCGKKVSP